MYEDTTDLDPYLVSIIPFMNCPNVGGMVISGYNFLSNLAVDTNSSSYSFLVKNCTSMNAVRKLRNQPQIECASDHEMADVASKFSVVTATVHKSFDPWAYNQEGGLQTQVAWNKLDGMIPY